MNKEDVIRILKSIKISENEHRVNFILGAIKTIPDEKLETMIAKIGNTEESIRNYLKNRIEGNNNNKEQREDKHVPINKMITYGVGNKCIHLHMPVDLHEMINEKGISTTIDIVNLYLLDAIEKLRHLQNDGYNKLQGKTFIYMISPILVGRESKFLSKLDFNIASYTKKELKDNDFVLENPEAQLAINLFGRNMNVGSAQIGMNVINSPEWQEKKKLVIKKFAEKGITLEDKDNQETLE